MLKGIPVSPGVAVGRVYVCESARDLRHLVEHTTAHSPETELMRLRDAARRANRELAQLVEEVRTELGHEEAAIFEAQRAILRDQAVEKEMLVILNQENMSAEKALAIVIEKYAQTVARAHDEHLRHRAADIRDIGQRALSILLNEDQKDLIAHEEHVVAVTRQVIPSRLVGLMQQKIAGVVSERGGRTSHAAILGRSYGIPAVTGVRGILDRIKLGDVVALDGSTGEIWLNPDKEILKSLNERRKERSTMWVKLQAKHDEPAHTGDGVQITVRANIRTSRDAHTALVAGAEGVGLFRTEFVYMNAHNPPDEEAQISAYRAVIEEMKPRPTTIRTLDLGGDKMPHGFKTPREDNPFLGRRSIRLSFEHPELLKTQLRAILRAAHTGPTKIMFPLVTTVDELRRAKEIVAQAKRELKEEELPHDPNVPVGLMIEVPAAALMIKSIMKEADFASIGTNDLIQYVMAADRTNPQVVELYDSLAPAVLHMIKYVVDGCREIAKPVAVCGEMAARPLTILALVGLGVTELSVGVTFVPAVKEIIRSFTMKEAKELADRALTMETGREIEDMYQKAIERVAPWAKEVV